MKKIMMLLASLTIMVLPMVKAAESIKMDAVESKSGVITVEGIADSSVIAVAVLVYDSTGTNLVTMQTTQTNDDDTFKTTITLDADTYVVKVANYNGGSYVEKKVTPSDDTIKVPNTLDNIGSYIAIAVVALVSIIASVICIQKQKA